MKNYFVALAFTALFLPVACACGTPEPARSGDGDPLPGNPGAKSYKNPVFREFLVADPTVIRAEDGNFYLYATESGKNNIPILRSSDLVNWTKVGEVFTAENHPQITDKAGANLWAPDINKIGDRYVLYYSQPGENNKHAIGVASGPSPVGPFTDHGKLIGSDEIGVDISIDQFYIEEDGYKYMFWGSFRGIWAIELADDGLSLKPGAGKRKIAGDQYEGTYIHKRDGYYYLIVSTGDFMKDYHVVVGRSRSLMGPYVDRAGRDMLGVHHELVVGNGNGFVAPGIMRSSLPTTRGRTGCSTTPGSRWAGRVTCCSTGSSGMTGGPRCAGTYPPGVPKLPFSSSPAGKPCDVRACGVHACDLYAMSVPVTCLRHRG